ncbi:MAG TPA: hypothetical protein VIG66_09900 [Noviherbaspirillum sp.]
MDDATLAKLAQKRLRDEIDLLFIDAVLQRGAFAQDQELDAKMKEAGYRWCPFTKGWVAL